MQKIKEEKGSIVLIVVVTMLFLTVLLVGMFVSNTNSDITSKQATQQIKENYEKDINNIEQVYQLALAEKNKTYVQEGLILHYDGINNTGNGHSATATTWKDLSGNENDGTLTNFNYTLESGWKNNGLKFDGIDDKIPTILRPESYTIQFTVTPYSIEYDKGIIGSGNMGIWFDSNVRICHGYSYGNASWRQTYYTPVYANISYNVVGTYNSSTNLAEMYINGIKSNEFTISGGSITDIRKLFIGTWSETVGFQNMLLNNMLIYNKVLNSEEIRNNFAVDVQKGYITEFTYAYTGGEQQFIAPVTGTYKIEAWGAQGGDIDTFIGGRGAYTKGEIELKKGKNLYLHVGGQGTNTDTGGYNGGSNLYTGQYLFGSSGGGATDIRLISGNWNNIDGLKSRIMVAAGGGRSK